MERDAGITKQKCATIAEAEMVAQCETPDIMLSYPMVGPNCTRFAQLVKKYPGSKFSVIADHAAGIAQLSDAMKRAGQQAEAVGAYSDEEERLVEERLRGLGYLE